MVRSKKLRTAGAVWGMGGTIAFIAYGIHKLWGFAWDLDFAALTAFEIYVLVLWVAYMLYTEGYKAFGKQFSPRVAARTQYLAREGTARQLILAPLFVFGYFHSSRRRMIATYSLTIGIVLLAIGIRYLPHPWRPILDIGALLGLSYGMITVFYFTWRSWRAHPTYIADPVVEFKK